MTEQSNGYGVRRWESAVAAVLITLVIVVLVGLAQ